jgi:hypothetical protein
MCVRVCTKVSWQKREAGGMTIGEGWGGGPLCVKLACGMGTSL